MTTRSYIATSLLILLSALQFLPAPPAAAVPAPKVHTSQAAKSSPVDLKGTNIEFLDSMTIADTNQKIDAYRLKSNGLTILLSERHVTPVVTTQIVYRVGSRNEAVGYTGSTHFLEHLMFKGTKKHDPLNGTGVDDTLKPVGGFNNATTSYDRTSYFEITPASEINVCLDLEADRMRHLLLRQSDRDAEMTVVRNELERGDDDPQELLQNNLFATAFKEHPYHHPVIGWRSDVENVPLARLRAFYDQFYWPNNATLMLIGDFESKTVLKEISLLFGSIPASPAPFPKVYTTEPPQEGERRFIVQRGSGLPRVVVGYHIPHCQDKDTYALDVLESILGDEAHKASRLYKDFMDTGLVSEVTCGAYEMRDPGMFSLTAAPSTGVSEEKIEGLLKEELTKCAKEGVTGDELDRAKKSLVKQLKLTCSDPMGLADQLVEAVATADWHWLSTYPAGIRSVTKTDVQRIAKKYFTPSNCTVGYYLPKEGAAKSEAPVASTEKPAGIAAGKAPDGTDGKQSADVATATPETQAQASKAAVDAHGDVAVATSEPTSPAKSNVPQAAPKVVPPLPGLKGKFATQVKTIVFPNGMTLLVMPIKGGGTVSVSARVRAGSYFRTVEKTGVPEMVADLLTKGAKNLSKGKLAEELEKMGTSLNFNTDNFFMGFTAEVASEDLKTFMPLVSETIQHPLFPAEELELTKKLKIASLKQRMDDTGEQAWSSFCLATYKPSSVYWNKTFEKQIEETNALTSEDMRSFHNRQMSPANTVFAIVGDISVKDAITVIQENFAAWSGSEATPIQMNADQVLPPSDKQIKIALADKSNADAIIGHPIPVGRQSKDFFPTLLANAALGFDSFSTRLAPVRDRYGLTYGISSSFQDDYPYSPWTIGFSVNPVNYTRTLKLVKDIADRYVKEGITQKELSHEKSHLKGAYFVGLRGPRQIAAKLSEYGCAGIGPEFIDDFGKHMDAVTITSANEAIRKYFNVDKSLTVVCGTFGKKAAKASKAEEED